MANLSRPMVYMQNNNRANWYSKSINCSDKNYWVESGLEPVTTSRTTQFRKQADFDKLNIFRRNK